MSLPTQLARNSLWILLARLGTQFSMVIVTYLLARRLGATGFGEYSFLAAAIVIGNTLTTFGSDMYLIREIAVESAFSALPAALFLQLSLSGFFIVLLFLAAPSIPNQSAESLLALRVYGFALIPLAFFTVFTSMLRGAQKMSVYAWLNFLVPAFHVTAVSLFVQRGTSIVTLAYLLLLIQIAGMILSGIFCLILFPGFWAGLRLSWAALISLFVRCLPIALMAVLGIVYQKMSIAMLSFLGTAAMVGFFSVAARVVEAARLGHFAIFTSLYPVMASAGQDASSRKTIGFSWFLLLAISAAASVLIFLLAKPLIDIFFGPDYQSSVSALKILAFTLIPYTVNSFLSLAFLARKMERIALFVLAASLSMLWILNLSFIPLAGELGASWAILTAEVLQAILFVLAWLSRPLPRLDAAPAKGVSYELSDLS